MKYLQNEKILLDKIIVMVYTISRKEKFFEIKKIGSWRRLQAAGEEEKDEPQTAKSSFNFLRD